MAEVTRALVEEISTACESLGWKNSTERRLVGVGFSRKRRMAITYQAIADLMEARGLGTVEETLKVSLQESQMVPEERVEDVEKLPVVEDVEAARLYPGDRFLMSAECLTELDVAKSGDYAWICEIAEDGSVKRVPVILTVPEEESK